MRRALVLAFALCGCGGTTGSALVTFNAVAGGPINVDWTNGFDTGSGYHVVLSAASLHLGAVYLNMSMPSSGGPEEPCLLPGIYVGQAFGACQSSGVCGVDVNLLKPDSIPFGVQGEGTANTAVEAEVWLTGGDVNDASDTTPIFQATGIASRNGVDWPFDTTVTIAGNRQVPPPNVAEPGLHPICRQRIVSPIALPGGLQLSDGGTLDVRVDPRGMFNQVDFASLSAGGTLPEYTIPDDQSILGTAMYKGVVANAGVYTFAFAPK
jgi:hypothetical protein